jgi:hypothetical protein
LRIFEHRILSVNLVLGLKVVGVRGYPVAIQGRSDVLVFHLDLPSLTLRHFKDGTPDAIARTDDSLELEGADQRWH